MKHTRRSINALTLAAVLVSAGLFLGAGGTAIKITVADLTTGQPISSGDTITAGDQFQVTVTVGKNVDCAGQLVTTALGAPGAPPAVLVQFQPFIIGPFTGSNSFTAGVLTSNGAPGQPNVWKISASCNGAGPNAFGFDKFEFTSAVP